MNTGAFTEIGSFLIRTNTTEFFGNLLNMILYHEVYNGTIVVPHFAKK